MSVYRTIVALVLEGSRDHAFICMDPLGTVTDWLGAAEDIFGHTAQEAVGQSLALIFTLEDRHRGFDHYELQVAGTDGRSEDDRWHVRKDGTRVWASGTVNAMRDDAGRLIGFVKIVRDQTALRTQIELLENQVASLREGRERTHLFLKTLGHEMRNPLGSMDTAIHIVRRLGGDLRIEGALQVMARQVAALTGLADDLMDVSRLESGTVALKLQRVDLRRLLSDAVTSSGQAAADKELRLETVLPDGPLEVDIDEARFQRLVLNLLTNAIKYTPAGGTIWVKATAEGSEIVFRVEDTGMGIAPDVLPQIFELFTRGSAAADRAPTGLGVGLAMVREIATLHGGSVQAQSSGTGKGAEFSVRLPVARL